MQAQTTYSNPRLKHEESPQHPHIDISPKKERDVLKRTWSVSRSAAMRLIACILGLGGLVIQLIVYRGTASIYVSGLTLLSDTCLVVAVTILRTEAGPFRSYIEERLDVLMKRMNDPIFDRMTNVKFLRDNFSSKYLLKFRRAAAMHRCLTMSLDSRSFYLWLNDVFSPVVPEQCGESVIR